MPRHCSGRLARWSHKVRSDYAHYYCRDSLGPLAAIFGLGAVMANTPLDQRIRDGWEQDVRSEGTDRLALATKQFGEGHYVFAAGGAALMAGHLRPDTPLGQTSGEWGDRTLRAVLVGAPAMLTMQRVTGASRPEERPWASHWRPFADDNGVSGHSFMGAIPFVTAAQMTDDPYWKAAWYAGSTMAAWSRVADDSHFTSQAVLGWSMAYLACCSVSQTQHQDGWCEIGPMMLSDGPALGVVWQR